MDEKILIFDPSEDNKENGSNIGVKRHKNLSFMFDRVFTEDSSNDDVYHFAAKDLIDAALNGNNATIFAYGATGSGKTYTMIGDENSGLGITGLAMQDLFNKINARKDSENITLTMSCIEVYNETIRDLFIDNNGSLCVSNLTQLHPSTIEEVQMLLEEGNSRRHQSPTNANQTSSRSHAIIQINVRNESKSHGLNKIVKYGKLSLIDLAGSERAARTLVYYLNNVCFLKNQGMRLVEGANINRSLLALANCINALVDKKKYIPYRDSKLTRLLKDSLSGDCLTSMIATISASELSYEDTQNTLTYAGRTRQIKTRKTIKTRLEEYTSTIAKLEAQVKTLKQKIIIQDNQIAPNYHILKELYENRNNLLQMLFTQQDTENDLREELNEVSNVITNFSGSDIDTIHAKYQEISKQITKTIVNKAHINQNICDNGDYILAKRQGKFLQQELGLIAPSLFLEREHLLDIVNRQKTIIGKQSQRIRDLGENDSTLLQSADLLQRYSEMNYTPLPFPKEITLTRKMSSFTLGRLNSNLSMKSLNSSASNYSSASQNTPPAKPYKRREFINISDPKAAKLMTPQRVLKKRTSESRGCIKTSVPVKKTNAVYNVFGNKVKELIFTPKRVRIIPKKPSVANSVPTNSTSRKMLPSRVPL